MLRVALVINDVGLGGAERIVTSLAGGLAAHGYAAQLVYLGGSRVQYGATGGNILALGYPRADPRVIIALAAWLRRADIDLVHLHLPRAGLVGRIAARVAGTRPILYTEHNARAGYGWITRILNTATLHWNDHVIAVSDYVRRDLIDSGFPGERITTIPNGIDAAALRSRSPNATNLRHLISVAEDTPVVGTIANLHPRKGLDTFVEALSLVHRSHPRLAGVIVGRDDGDGRRIRSIIRRERLDGTVHLLGARSDAIELLRQFTVFVLSSRVEGLPVALLEAMALARPVVASEVGGMPEAVRDGETGRLARPGDPTSLGAALIALLSDPGEAEALGMRGARRVEEAFSMAKMLDAHATLYHRLLASAPTRGG